jgi:poly [ADP-ribose] polymerase
MPPKRGTKAAAPAKPALDGCKIVLSGTFPGATHASIKTRAEVLGATVASSLTDDATHLVATEADYKKPSPKVTKAQSLGIHIVGIDWLSLSEQSSTKEPEAGHVLGAPVQDDDPAQTDPSKVASSQANGTGTTTTIASSRTRKRATPAAADNVSDTEAAPKAKKTRGRKTAAAKADADADADEDEDVQMKDANGATDADADVEPKAEEKGKGKAQAERAMGQGQVAKSSDMQIPLDEGCLFPTSKVYIDDSGVIYDASLNQTNSSNNNNKFYRIQVRYRPNVTTLSRPTVCLTHLGSS